MIVIQVSEDFINSATMTSKLSDTENIKITVTDSHIRFLSGGESSHLKVVDEFVEYTGTGEFLVQKDSFVALATMYNGGVLKVNDKAMQFEKGENRVKIALVDPCSDNRFFESNEEGKYLFAVRFGTLKEVIKNIKYAVAKGKIGDGSGNDFAKCFYFQNAGNNQIYAQAVDGVRGAYKTFKGSGNVSDEFATVYLLADKIEKFVSFNFIDDDAVINVLETNNKYYLSSGSVTMVLAKLATLNDVDRNLKDRFESAICTEDNEIELDYRVLCAAMKQAEILISAANTTRSPVILKYTAGDEYLTVSLKTATNSFKNNIPMKPFARDITIGFNHAFLYHVTSEISPENSKAYYVDSVIPMLFYDNDSETCHIVLPVKTN